MRRVMVVVSIGVLLLASLAVVAKASLVRVPDVGGTLDDARRTLRKAGLSPSGSPADGSRRSSLGVEGVVAQLPKPGAVVLIGSTVRLETEPENEKVIVPGVVGMFVGDAVRTLAAAGLVPSGSRDPMDEASIVHSQEPSAGAVVPFASIVGFEGVFPHRSDGTIDPRAKALHGVIYARYGVEGAVACKECHSADTCYSGKCHSESAYRSLRQMTPDPR